MPISTFLSRGFAAVDLGILFFLLSHMLGQKLGTLSVIDLKEFSEDEILAGLSLGVKFQVYDVTAKFVRLKEPIIN